MSRGTTAVAIAGLVLAGGLSLASESGAQATPTPILVRPCSAGDDCQPCAEPEVQGLRFQTPGEQAADRQHVRCSKASGAPRCSEGARIEWRFLQLRSGETYRVVVAYDPNTNKYPVPTPPYVFEDVYGTVSGNGSGPTFPVVSPPPTNGQRVWPYSVEVFRTTGGADQLVACADPEIIIDP